MPGTFSRKIYLISGVICVGSLIFAYLYLERHLGLAPCPLCILDRIVLATLAGCFFIALIHNPAPAGQRIYAIITLLLSAIGMSLAGRHIYLQNLPKEEIPDCLPDFGYMLEKFSWPEMIQTIFNSAGECAEIAWTFLGLTIPQQTLLLFIVLAILSVVMGLKVSTNTQD